MRSAHPHPRVHPESLFHLFHLFHQPHGKVPLSMTKFEIRLHAWFGHAALPFGSGHLCTCGRWFR